MLKLIYYEGNVTYSLCTFMNHRFFKDKISVDVKTFKLLITLKDITMCSSATDHFSFPCKNSNLLTPTDIFKLLILSKIRGIKRLCNMTQSLDLNK